MYLIQINWQAIAFSFAFLAIILVVFLILSFFKIANERAEHERELAHARNDAVKKSKAIIRGHVSQELIPLIQGFPYVLSDCKLSGNPLDYIVFDGMSEFRDGNKDKEINIIFADVKYGKAHKTPVQNEIVKAINNGRVRFEEWKINENNELTIK